MRAIVVIALVLLGAADTATGQCLPWRRGVEQRLIALERRQAQPAPQQPIIIYQPAPPLQVLPVPGQPLQPLPVPGVPLQPLPVPGVPLQPLPTPGVPLQPLPAPGAPGQPLPIVGQPPQVIPLGGPQQLSTRPVYAIYRPPQYPYPRR